MPEEIMSKAQFMAFVREWERVHALLTQAKAPDFGAERTFEDWIGSLEAFRAINTVFKGALRDA